MMKLLVTIVLLISIISGVFGYSMDLYSIDSQEWKVASALCIANGVLPPSSVSPCTEEEILYALSTIPPSKLDVDERSMLEALYATFDSDRVLESESVAIDSGIVVSPEMYAQTSKLSKQLDYAFDIKDMNPFLDISIDFYLYDNLLMFADYLFISPGLKSQFDSLFGSNMDSLMDFQHEGIFNSGLVAGNKYIYGGIFRTRQSMGYGMTGNLMVADNFSRQDYARFHLNSKWFDYTLNLTHFDQSKPSFSTTDIQMDDTKFNGMHQIQGVHRFEGKFFDKVRVVFQEGMMLNSSSAFDFRLLNPFIYFHGLYNFSESIDYDPGKNSDEANNYISLELGWILYPHIALNLQLLADQIQIGGEKYSPTACPQAFGGILNIESPWGIGSHYLNSWYESVLIMPYTYLNRKELENSAFDTNLDMITGYHNSNQDEIGYAGYRYGGDSIVNAFGMELGKLDLYQFGFSFTYLIHGKYGYGYSSIIPERGESHLNDMMLIGVGFSGAEHRLITELEGVWYPIDGLEVGANITLLQVFNHLCHKDENVSDVMFKVCLKFDPLEIFL